jgi:hypothetical protein
MTNKEKAELYRKVIEAYSKTHITQFNQSANKGLCTFLKDSYILKFTNHNQRLFLKSELFDFMKLNKISRRSYLFPEYEYEPRLQYLENRLSHYQKLSENEKD